MIQGRNLPVDIFTKRISFTLSTVAQNVIKDFFITRMLQETK